MFSQHQSSYGTNQLTFPRLASAVIGGPQAVTGTVTLADRDGLLLVKT